VSLIQLSGNTTKWQQLSGNPWKFFCRRPWLAPPKTDAILSANHHMKTTSTSCLSFLAGISSPNYRRDTSSL